MLLKKTRLQFRYKIIMTIIMSVLICVITTSLISIINSKQLAEQVSEKNLLNKLDGDIKSAHLYLEQYFGVLSFKNGQLIDKNNKPIDGRFEMVDSILEDLGDTATIFVKKDDDFVRVITNIIKSDGSRAIGTMLGKDSAAYESVMNGKLYTGEAEILNKSYYTAYDPMKDENGNVVGILYIGVNKNYVTDIISTSIQKMTLHIMIAAILLIILMALYASFMSRKLMKPVENIVNLLKDIAEGEGDLTKRLNVNSNDEIGQLAKWFNVFVSKLYVVVKDIISNTEVLTEAIEKSATAMEQANQGASEVANSVTMISEGAQNNSCTIEQTAVSIDGLANSADEISKKSYDMDNNGRIILEASNKGSENIEEVVVSIEKVDDTSTKVSDLIKELKTSSEKIGEVILVMTHITEQTNLLALNAAIESARAGEVGKGFAVVAEEIRKLAEESKKSADQITHIITDIQTKIEITGSFIEEEQNIVKLSVEKINNTSKEFVKIHNLVEEMTEKIKMMAESSKQQSAITRDMTKAMDSITVEVQNSANASQEVSASIEEQVSIFEEVGLSIDKIRDISGNLKNQTDKFQV